MTTWQCSFPHPGTARHSGAAVEIAAAHVLTLQDGRVTRTGVSLGRQEAVETAGLRELDSSPHSAPACAVLGLRRDGDVDPGGPGGPAEVVARHGGSGSAEHRAPVVVWLGRLSLRLE